MKSRFKKVAIVLFFAMLGAAPFAFAHGGYGGPGYGGHMMGPGYGGHMMGYGGHMGWWGDRDDGGLNQEQAEKLQTARESFYRENRELRDSIYDKSAEIRSELSKQNPDRGRLNELQKELSQLESRFDQKRLDYQLEVRKILPQTDGEYSEGYGPGGGWCWR
jgi:zinc resistance-associated protein